MVVASLSACAVVTNKWSLFGPPKVHAVTEKTVGKCSSKVTEVPVGSKRRILEPPHLLKNQYIPWFATKLCRVMPASEIGWDDIYEPGTPNAAFTVDTEPIAEAVGRQVESLAFDEIASIGDSAAFEIVVVGEDLVHK
jgi:hypothetical protein